MLQSLALTAPAHVMTSSALVLLLVAAYAGDRSARLITWLAILAFLVAAIVLPNYGGGRAGAYGGLIISDGF